MNGAIENGSVRLYPLEWFCTLDFIEQELIDAGAEISRTALYHQRAGQSRNIPIVRIGTSRVMPDESICLVWRRRITTIT